MNTLFDLPTSAGGADVRAFAGTPESVSAARAWVAGFLPGSTAADDVALMTSELVTNAIQYSASRLPGGVVLVGIRTGKTWIRVDVFDQGEIPPGLAASSGLGQGLEIVRQLADAYGDEDGSRWFSLHLGGARWSPRGRHAEGACPWPGCPKHTKASYLMCREHWYALPFEIRERILATFRPGQTVLAASPEYLEALRDALRYAASQEGGDQ